MHSNLKPLLTGTFALLQILLPGCKMHTPEKLEGLIKQLESADTHERNTAALGIASYGVEGKPAVKNLKLLLRDENSGVRSSAAYALRSIGTKEATAALDGYTK